MDKFQNVLKSLNTNKAIMSDTWNATEIQPGLWIGNAQDACSLTCNSKVKRILNLGLIINVFEKENHERFASAYNAFITDGSIDGRDQVDINSLRSVEYMNVYLLDNEKSDLSVHFKGMNEFIGKGDCLVHCQAGISRSSTSLIAHLMSTGLCLKEAYRLVKSKRKIIRPNPAFWLQLIAYNSQLYPDDNFDYSTINK